MSTGAMDGGVPMTVPVGSEMLGACAGMSSSADPQAQSTRSGPPDARKMSTYRPGEPAAPASDQGRRGGEIQDSDGPARARTAPAEIRSPGTSPRRPRVEPWSTVCRRWGPTGASDARPALASMTLALGGGGAGTKPPCTTLPVYSSGCYLRATALLPPCYLRATPAPCATSNPKPRRWRPLCRLCAEGLVAATAGARRPSRIAPRALVEVVPAVLAAARALPSESGALGVVASPAGLR